MLVSKKISSGEKNYKYFLGYLYNDHKNKSLHIMLPKTSPYVKSCDGQTKWMYFLIENGDFLEKYNTVWDKVSADIIIASLCIIKIFWKPNKISR